MFTLKFTEPLFQESKQILGIDQFQTRKWLAWQHQVALNFLVSSFILKEKLLCFDDLPLLSARDIKEIFVFKLYQEMTEEKLMNKMFKRHLIRQRDINYSYSKLKCVKVEVKGSVEIVVGKISIPF